MAQAGRQRGAGRRGMALVEVVVASLLVGVLFVAVLNTLGAAQTTTLLTARRLRALQLAQDLLGEALGQAYADETGAATLGPDGAEHDAGRAGFDDVDDYHKLIESPVVERDGAAAPGATGLSRGVAVTWVRPGDLTPVEVETGIKRVTVAVWHGGKKVVELVGLRAEAAP